MSRLRSCRHWVASQFGDRHFSRTLFLLLALLYSGFSLVRANTYLIGGYDAGIFDQAIRHYAHFQLPYVTLKGDGYLIWADHFHPIIMAWAPLYWIWDNIAVLGIGQGVVVALTVFPAWRFVRRHMTNKAWAKVFVAAMMLFWPIQSLINFDVHEIAFALPLLAWVIEALDRRDDRGLVIASALLLLVREDMGALVFMIGLVRLIWWKGLVPDAEESSAPPPRAKSSGGRRRPRDWVVALALMIGGLVVFYLVTSVVIPHFNPGGFQYWNYPALGDSPSQAVVTAVTKPWRVVSLFFFPWDKTLTWACLLVPLALLPLRSPYALIAAPIMAERFLAGRWTLWSIDFHYNAPVWIVFALAAVDAVARMKPVHLDALRSGLRRVFHLRSITGRGAVMEAASKLLGVAVVLGMVLAATRLSPVEARMFTFTELLTGRAYHLSAQQQARADVVAWLPRDTCVAADGMVAGSLTHRNRVTVPSVSQHRQDFYALDLSEPTPTLTPAGWTTMDAYAHATGLGFVEVYRSGSIVGLQAPDYTGPDPTQCGPDAI
ncbi:MAG: DUF2079 domain-containing protein [Propionibacteriaceae bacterium]|nr:DUF2079 domain-containing protein [Propionibacteriaceae bacterium]